MTKYDRMSSLFLLGLSLAICEESLRLGTGSVSVPGPGLVPVGCGLILGILALILFTSTFKRSVARKDTLWKSGGQWGKIISTLFSVIAYSFLIEPLGFLSVTFLWMIGIYVGLGKMGWKKAVLASAVTTLSCVVLFGYFLDIRFPRGIFGF